MFPPGRLGEALRSLREATQACWVESHCPGFLRFRWLHVVAPMSGRGQAGVPVRLTANGGT
jgi:hypothetical protein